MDSSQPQRLLLLIDLQPHLLLPLPDNPNPNPNPYSTSILAAVRALLSSLPPTALTASKPIFSSLSPILSTSLAHHLLGKSPSSLSFDLPSKTLASLSRTLSSLPSFSHHDNARPCASTLAQSLLQLEHDYAWEPGLSDFRGMRELLAFPSNLVVLFSPYPRGLVDLLEFLDLETGNDEKLTLDVLVKKFLRVFGPVNERFVSKGIHVCWIDVSADLRREKEGDLAFGMVEKGIREIGWGCVSTDSIVMGSALVPFGLVFPEIGCRMGFRSCATIRKTDAELVLEIADVNNKPLESKFCDLEVLDLMPVKERPVTCDRRLSNKDSDIKHIHVNGVIHENEGEQFVESSNGVLLICGVSGECRKDSAENSKGDFFAGRVLELLSHETDGFVAGTPVWQIIMSFLHNRSYVATVSISDSSGNLINGILKPFTVNYALLYIVETESLVPHQLVTQSSNCFAEFSDSMIDGRKKKKVSRQLLQDISWSSFRELVFSQDNSGSLGVKLEDVYFAREPNKSKKLRFLKCWTRQIRKSNGLCQLTQKDISEPLDAKKVKEIETSSQLEPKPQDISMSDSGHACSIGAEREDCLPFSSLEDVGAFLQCIPQKIEQGLDSEEVDLSLLAERLVSLCTKSVRMKFRLNKEGDSVNMQPEDASIMDIVAELSGLLLQKPKELLLKYKGCTSATISSASSLASNSTEKKIRDHELQILLRMEVFRSNLGDWIEENLKQKMIKEVCSLLQNIEFDLEGDLFHGESLVDFSGRVLKSRYAHSLGDVIHKIYNLMEFFSFDGEDIGTSESFNSNDNESQRDKHENTNILEADTQPTRASTCHGTFKTSHPPKADAIRQQDTIDKVHQRQLMRAQERRNRHRRFTAFTSWIPDLRRVWALKQPKAEKTTRGSIPKLSEKRKRRLKVGDVVCETPMSDKKKLTRLQGDEDEVEDDKSSGINLRRSLSKALFQTEGDW